MRRISSRRMAIQQGCSEDRKMFKFSMRTCAVCGPAWRNKYPPALDVHEIIRGGQRAKMVADRRSWLCVCRTCHEKLSDFSMWPIVFQFALKKITDENWFDLDWLNDARGDGVGYTDQDIDEAVRRVGAMIYGKND